MFAAVIADPLPLHPSILVLSITLLVLAVSYGISQYQRAKQPLPPGRLLTWPFIGETLEFFNGSNPAEFFWSRYQKYGPVFRVHLFGKENFVVGDAKIARSVEFVNNTTHALPVTTFTTIAGQTYNMKDRTSRHDSFRKNMLEALSTTGIAAKLPTIITILERHVSTWLQRGTVELDKDARCLVMEVALSSIMGLLVEKPDMPELLNQALTVNSALFTAPINLPGTTWSKALSIRPAYLERLKQLLLSRFGPLPWNVGGAHDTTAALVKEFQQAGDETEVHKMAERLIQNVAGASETTSGTMFSVMVLLARVPEAMRKVREEQAKITAQFGDSLSMEALSSMTYLDAVVKETARIAGAAHGFWRTADKDLAIGQYVIPKGSLIHLPIDLFHCLDPSCVNSDTSKGIPSHMDLSKLDIAFKPERWLDPATRPRNFFSFGYGNHLCIGMNLAIAEVKCLVALLARQYTWQLVDESKVMKFVPSIHMSKGPTHVRFERLVG